MRSKAAIQSHPIHPMLIAFPIGLFVTSLIFDAVGVQRANASLWAAGWYCIVAGLGFSLLAAVPGVIDLFLAVPPDSSGRTRGYLHAGANVFMLAIFLTVAAHRGGAGVEPDRFSLVLSIVGVIVLGVSGWLGGTLVYRNQIGVDHRYANAGQWKTVSLNRWQEPVCKEADLQEGQMMLAEIRGQRIAVGRCAEGLVAFSDRCTHSGGPLSDGALVGCTVQCPWHGSQFDVHTGEVVNGPAQDEIETFEAAVEDGKVFVRPRRGQQSKRAA